MAFNPNGSTLSQQLDKMSLKTESKYDEDSLDEAITNGLKGEHRSFCLKIETLLNQFMASQKNIEVIPNLDKYQRKIVHKICDLYNIKREYVDVKTDETGSVSPTITLEERYQKYLDKSKKQPTAQSSNPFANKKVLIKTRLSQPDKKTESEKSDKSGTDSSKATQSDKGDAHDEVEHKKKKEYEEARDRIMQGNEEKPPVPEPNVEDGTNKVNVKTKKKGRFSGYDPDYDRSKTQSSGMSGPINMGLPNPMGGMPGMPMMPGMVGMPMGGMGMPGPNPMSGMGGPMGFYPVYSAPFIPYSNFPMHNQPGFQPNNFPAPTYPPNLGPYNNFGPQFQTGNTQFNGSVGGGGAGAGAGPGPGVGAGTGTGPVTSNGYFQNFPTLGRENNPKKQ